MKLVWMILLSLGVHFGIGLTLSTRFLPTGNPDFVDISVQSSPATTKSSKKSSPANRSSVAKSAGSSVAQTWPELVSQPKIVYPQEWQQKNLSGVVKAKLKISSLGQVDDVVVLESESSEMADVATEAMRAFRFRPASHDGKAIASEIEYSYRFVLR